MDYFTDEIPQTTGPALKRHLQFIPSGSDKVRQFSRGSNRRRQDLDRRIRLHLHAQK